jgi:fatty acid desaturase
LPYRNKGIEFAQRKLLAFRACPAEEGDNVRVSVGHSGRINGAFDMHDSVYGEKESLRGRRPLPLYKKLILLLRGIRSFLPGGAWWKIHGSNQGDEQKISVLAAMHRLWILIGADGFILGIAFFALIVAAVSLAFLFALIDCSFLERYCSLILSFQHTPAHTRTHTHTCTYRNRIYMVSSLYSSV